MKYVDYREKLGIGFNDEQKVEAVINKIRSFFYRNREALELKIHCDLSNITRLYADETCVEIYDFTLPGVIDELVESFFDEDNNLKGTIAKFVIFTNILINEQKNNSFVEEAKRLIPTTLKQIKIPYEIIKDEDGEFLFPKGVEELDSALVSEPLEWLKDYPQTKKTYVIALKQYSDGIYIRDVADNLRKTLEAFFQEFLGNKKNLANNINEVFKFLGAHNAEPELAGSIKDLLSKYDSLNNKIAKHNDKVDARYLEFLLYQTGIFIRMLITVKNTDAKESSNAN